MRVDPHRVGGVDTQALIEATRLEEALGERDRSEAAFWAAVDGLGRTLQADDRRAMAGALPDAVVSRLLSCPFDPEASEATVDAQVAEATELPGGQALEIVQVVARTLASRLPEDLRSRLERHARGTLARLWTRPAVPPAPPKPVHTPPPGSGHTLATGRPGSRHPVSEAGPIGQADSIAVNPDPHGETKLSGARGATTAEREHRTLAEGRPGSEHPLSEAGED